MSRLDWKPWHDVVQLRDDLKSGELSMAMFAADLYDVKIDKARPIYQELDKFFAFTYPTLPLRNLVGDVLRRLAGKNDKAVRQLALTYGGGKTHTLITLYHLANQPDNLPDLPAAHEFTGAVGMDWPRARIAVLPFDKLDTDKGLETIGPDGTRRRLKQIWSILAYQIAGSDGLRLLHADDLDEERDEKSPPSEEVLSTLLRYPAREGLATLILIDEVLMFARLKVGQDPEWQQTLNYFFQCLTQAATKVDSCCVVASLLATDPKRSDERGRQIMAELENIFSRQREELIQPVGKEDAAEVLRRRFFTPESIKDQRAFRPHVQAALVGIVALDDATRKQRQVEEERFLKSYPFHPDLTDIFYTKWTALDNFQRTRGVLRTYAMALREAEAWDESPLVSVNVFLNKKQLTNLSEAGRELANVAETEEYEGKRQAWASILESELEKARKIQQELSSLDRFREVEQIVFATFLHSQPIGSTQQASTRDLLVLVGDTRPDRIEMGKALQRWTELSWFLDEKTLQDRETGPEGTPKLPKNWRLGGRPNLKQMHDDAREKVPPEAIEAQLDDQIRACKSLVDGIPAGVHKPHLLPDHPRDIGGKGEFHYAILGPKAASLSGNPSEEARRFLDQKNGPNNPRTDRNALILAVPSVDGLRVVENAIRDVLGWQSVEERLKGQEVDETRKQLLQREKRQAQNHLNEMVRQAYCIAVTVDRNDQDIAFRVIPDNVSLFGVISKHPQARIQDTAISSDALLPDSGSQMELFKAGEQSRPLSYLIDAFASDVRLPKLLNQSAILDTLLEGCRQGIFIFRTTRPDRSTRTFWYEQPDEAALRDPSIEVVLSEYATLSSLDPALLQPGTLPELWQSDVLSLQELYAYFSGKVVQMHKKGDEGQEYSEPVFLPKASREVINAAVQIAVKGRSLWLRSGRASLLAEEVAEELLIDEATLQLPPRPISASEILPENLPEAWENGYTNAHAIADALSGKIGQVLPWVTVKATIETAFSSRWLERTLDSGPWPCDYAGARSVRISTIQDPPVSKTPPESPGYSHKEDNRPRSEPTNVQERSGAYGLSTEAVLEVYELQNLVEQLGALERETVGLKLTYQVRINLEGSADHPIPNEIRDKVNTLLSEASDKLNLH
jgi:uncharacterized protein